MNSDIERDSVRRLQCDLSIAPNRFRLESPKPPAPDVRLYWNVGGSEAFEVTEVHPDEQPGRGSPLRATTEALAKCDPRAVASHWVQPGPMPAIIRRVLAKIGKAPGYHLDEGEALSLLVAGALATPAAVAPTFIFAPLVDVMRLNNELHSVLTASRFQRAYIHLQLGHAIWTWTRTDGWRALRESTHVGDGRDTLEILRRFAGGGVCFPGQALSAVGPSSLSGSRPLHPIRQ